MSADTVPSRVDRFADSSRPILTPKSVLPLFFLVGIILAPIGGVLLWASYQVYSRVSPDGYCAG